MPIGGSAGAGAGAPSPSPSFGILLPPALAGRAPAEPGRAGARSVRLPPPSPPPAALAASEPPPLPASDVPRPLSLGIIILGMPILGMPIIGGTPGAPEGGAAAAEEGDAEPPPPPPRSSLTIPMPTGGAGAGAGGGSGGGGVAPVGAAAAKSVSCSAGNCAGMPGAPPSPLESAVSEGSMQARSEEHSTGWPSAWPHSSASRWFSSRAWLGCAGRVSRQGEGQSRGSGSVVSNQWLGSESESVVRVRVEVRGRSRGRGQSRDSSLGRAGGSLHAPRAATVGYTYYGHTYCSYYTYYGHTHCSYYTYYGHTYYGYTSSSLGGLYLLWPYSPWLHLLWLYLG